MFSWHYPSSPTWQEVVYSCKIVGCCWGLICCVFGFYSSLLRWWRNKEYWLLLKPAISSSVPLPGLVPLGLCTLLSANPDISPDIQTFHALVDGCLVERGVRSAKGAVYQTWRMLVMREPSIQPDIDLINKLIRCCEVCRDFDRAFFFLSALNDFSLHPNLETFSLLFRVRTA